MVELGRGQQEAIDEMSEGLRDFRATGAGIGLPHFLSLLVGAYEKTGRFQDGLRTLREAIAIVNEHDEGRFEAELNRLMGEFLLEAERFERCGSSRLLRARDRNCTKSERQVI
jgi:hypothetical protein